MMFSPQENSSTNQGYTSPPPAVSLPKGGGAIKGIGEKFAVNPVTGTGSLSVPIFTTPSRSDFYPQLTLSYDSGAGNGVFGLGWDLSVPSITRKTDKGLPRYFDGEDSDVFILSGAEDLVPVLVWDKDEEQWEEKSFDQTEGTESYTVRRYRPRIEGLFARIERWQNKRTGKIHWRSLSKDNITSIYGRSPELNSRIVDPADDSGTRVFKWLLEASYDDLGNLIVYEYKQENAAGRDESAPQENHRLADGYKYANVYLKRIWYGNVTAYRQGTNSPQKDYLDIIQNKKDDWLFQVVFDYGEHGIDNATLQGLTKTGVDEGNWQGLKPEELKTDNPTPDEERSWLHRPDAFSTYRAGFEVRTQRLCRRVLMFHRLDEQGELQFLPSDNGTSLPLWHLVRSTDFGYEKDPVATYLVAAKQTGYVREKVTQPYTRRWLPPLEMHYDRPQFQRLIQTIAPESLENLPMGLDGSEYQWVDLDSEGISGILTEQGTGWFYKRNLGAAQFGPAELVATKPSVATLESPQQRVMDLAGDGTQDIVLLGELTGYYQREAEGKWRNFRSFESVPNVDWHDPNLRFIDLNGDGHGDILIAQDELFVWYPSQARQGFGAAETVCKAQDEKEGPALVFADGTQSVYLADMSGDGLNDLVRIGNGEVCYWPSLGYGRFGAKVTMDGSPYFDHPELFDQQRVRLADIDGSGTTDIIYLGREEISLWLNQAGNGFRRYGSQGGETPLTQFPTVDDLATVQAIDLLGNGTACLVWSSPLPGQQPMRYIDLMGGQKPHLMTSVVNNLGAETKLHYAPSTKFYLQDRKEGKPWITRLPFPVHVVERVETCDLLTGNRFVSLYRYRHGYFDGEEREFRGFGYVEQWDTEEYAELAQGHLLPGGTNEAASSHVPPVHTKTWFHTGFYLNREHISRLFAEEYYQGDAEAVLLADTILPGGLTAQEEREACRALKGQVLRQEVYALDGTDEAAHPYTVTESNYEIRQVQPLAQERHGVFFVHPRESLAYHYERSFVLDASDTEPDPRKKRKIFDPRVLHEMTLEVDEFGNVLKSVTIAYPRRQPQGLAEDPRLPEQKQTLVTYTEATVINEPDEADWYRLGLPGETRTYEITGVTPPTNNQCFQMADFYGQDKISGYFTAASIDYEETPNGTTPQKRLIEHQRVLYRPNSQAKTLDPTPLPLGQVESLALPAESYELSLTPGLVKQIFGSRVRDRLLTDEGKYVKLDGGWWIPSGRQAFDPQQFYLPVQTKDPLGQVSSLEYDSYRLLTVKTVDPLQNTVLVENNYRTLQPRQITDPNGNRDAVSFDALGMVVATAVMGKAGEGDSLTGFEPDLDQETIRQHLKAPLTNPHLILGKATTRLVYDLWAYYDTKTSAQPQPAVVYTLARETHVSDLKAGQKTKIQHSFLYSDGFGRELQTKIQAEPGLAPARDASGKLVREDGKVKMTDTDLRWVGTGRKVYNNKGKPVKQYEPFFSDTHQYETEKDLVEWGVTPILFYDPLERVVATLHPNHTYEKVVFDPWQQATWDVNDTVVQADPKTDPDVGHFFQVLPEEEYLPTWHTLRTDAQASLAQWPDVDPQTQKSLPGNAKIRAAERSAAEKAAIQAETPTIAIPV